MASPLPTTTVPSPLLSLQAAAARFGLSVSTLRTAVQANEIAFVRLGSKLRGRIWLTEAAVLEWINTRTTRPRATVPVAPQPALTLEQLMPPPNRRRFA